MCIKQKLANNSEWMDSKKYRLADFFDQWWEIYKKAPKHYITPEQYKAVNDMRLCRTEALGVDHYACPDCAEITKVYHSCKNRFCPTCSWTDTIKWAEKIKLKMMDLPHRHVVFTLPHQLNDLIKDNGAELLNILFRSAADTLSDWMGNKYNIKPGIISVLHTFGEIKQYHVHVHMIVSWGGIHNQTKELYPIQGEYVNYSFLKDNFQRKFNQKLIEMFDRGTLYHPFSDRINFMKFIRIINQKRWIIKLEPAMEIPTQVIRYIGRYSKRACLSEYKITKIEGEFISFRYKDNKNKDINNKPIEKIERLNYRDFFPRLLQHVPLKYFRVVRYYRLYSNKASIPEQYLYTHKNDQDNPEESIGKIETLNPLICSHCEKTKIYLYTLLRKRNKTKIIIYRKRILHPDKVPNQNVA